MRKISGEVLSTKPVSLSRAAKLITRFAAVDNGSTPSVALYLERAAEAFNHLVQFHKKPSQIGDVGDKLDRERIQKLRSDWLENNLDEDKAGDSENRGKEGSITVAEGNPNLEEEEDLNNGGQGEVKKKKKKKKKKRKDESVDSGEKKSNKKPKAENPDF